MAGRIGKGTFGGNSKRRVGITAACGAGRRQRGRVADGSSVREAPAIERLRPLSAETLTG